jgi:hypothetical protein
MNESMNDSSLTGLELRHTFVGHKDSISGLRGHQMDRYSPQRQKTGISDSGTEKLKNYVHFLKEQVVLVRSVV